MCSQLQYPLRRSYLPQRKGPDQVCEDSLPECSTDILKKSVRVGREDKKGARSDNVTPDIREKGVVYHMSLVAWSGSALLGGRRPTQRALLYVSLLSSLIRNRVYVLEAMCA